MTQAIVGLGAILIALVFLHVTYRGPRFLNKTHEIYRLRGIVNSQTGALNHWRRAYDGTQLEARVRQWVETRLRPQHMNRKERALRLLEESIELAQAEGVLQGMAAALMAHVYRRPRGEPVTEAANVAVCLYGWCAASGNNLADIAGKELLRLESLPDEKIRASLYRKVMAGLVTGEALQTVLTEGRETK